MKIRRYTYGSGFCHEAHVAVLVPGGQVCTDGAVHGREGECGLTFTPRASTGPSRMLQTFEAYLCAIVGYAEGVGADDFGEDGGSCAMTALAHDIGCDSTTGPDAVGTWLPDRPVPLDPAPGTDFLPVVKTMALVFVVVGQVFGGERQAGYESGHGLRLIGEHHVSYILSAEWCARCLCRRW